MNLMKYNAAKWSFFILSMCCLLSSVLGYFIINPPMIIDQMYETPKGLKVIASVINVEIARNKTISVSLHGFVLFLVIATYFHFQCKITQMEKQIKNLTSLNDI